MNTRSIILMVMSFQLCLNHHGQISFTLPPSACVNSSLALSANTGSLPAPQITWLTSPYAVFSNSLSANTVITFTSAGSYTILLVAISGTNLAFSQSSIQVYANPTPTLYSIPPAVCPSGNFTLSTILPPMGVPNYTFILPGNPPVVTGSVPTLPTVAPSSSAFPAVYSVSVEVAGCSGIASTAVQQLSLHPFFTASPNPVCAGYSSTLTVYPNTLSSYTFSVLSPSIAAFPNGSNPVFTVSPTQATIYQVLVDSANCTGSATLNLNISPPLNINVSASSLTTCLIGNSPKLSKPITLNASGANNYMWFPYDPATMTYSNGPVIQVRPHSTTCYTVIGNTSTCSGSATVCITVSPQFSFVVSPASASICLGQTLVLSTGSIGPEAVGPVSSYSYIWTDTMMNSTIVPPYIATVTVSPPSNMVYTVEIVDSQNCVSTPQQSSITVFPCTDISEHELIQLNIGPNPIQEILKISSESIPIKQYELFSSAGNNILCQCNAFEPMVESFELDLQHLSPGYYILIIHLEDGTRILRKIIKTS